MKRPGVIPVLLGLDLVLLLALAALWLTPQGRLRGTHWPVPAAVAPQLASADATSLPPPGVASASRFLATLERPLFSPTRRPPPAAAASDAPPEPDPLADIQLQGLYTAQGGGGIFARVAGKNLRVPVGGKLGGWTVKGIDDREVTLVRGAEVQTLRLAPARLGRPGAASAPGQPAPGQPAPVPPATTPGTTPGTTPAASPPVTSQADNPLVRQQQEREERQRARRALNNQRRIANGLPPLPDDR